LNSNKDATQLKWADEFSGFIQEKINLHVNQSINPAALN
jgi:hypothetical protein